MIALIAVNGGDYTENTVGIQKISECFLGNKRLQKETRVSRGVAIPRSRVIHAPCNMATVINQRVNYGSVDESIPASARTRNIHADGFPSRVRQVTGGRGEEGEGARTGDEKHERGETRPEALDGRGDANDGLPEQTGGREEEGRDSTRHRHPGASD